MVDKKTFLLQMDELLETPPGTLTGEEVLKDIEMWDSVALISFMVMIKEHYNLILAPKEIWSCITVNDLMTLVGRPSSDG